MTALDEGFLELKPLKISGRLKGFTHPVASSAIWPIAQSIVILVGTAIITALAARHYGPEVLGKLNFAMALAALLTAVATLGMEPVVIKYLSRDPVQSVVILGAAMRLRFVAGITAAVLAAVAGSMFATGENTSILAFTFAATLVVRTPEILLAWYRTTHQMGGPAVWRVCAFAVAGALRIYLLAADASIAVYGLTYLLEAALYAMGLLLAFRRNPRRNPATKDEVATPPDGYTRSILRDSLPLAVAGLAISLYSRIDQVMLGVMTDSYTVGLYASSVQVSEMWFFLPMALVGALVPIVMTPDGAIARRGLIALYGVVNTVSVLVGMAVAVLAKDILWLLYGAQYLDAAPTLRILSASSVMAMMGVCQAAWMVAAGLQRFTMVLTIAGAGVNIVLNLVLIPRVGGQGAAIATVLSQAVVVLVLPALIPALRPAIVDLVGVFRLRRTYVNIRAVLKDEEVA